MLSWFFDDLFYVLAVAALVVGAVGYVLSYFVGFIPALKPHALILKVVGIVLILLGGYYVADHRGYQRRVDEDKAEIERLNGEARAKEAELNTKLATANTALRKAKNDVKTKQADLTSRADAGELRLPSSCSLQADSSSTSTRGNTTNESDTERQAIKDLIAIAAEGDTAITQLNACISTYNSVRETVNAGVK